MTHHSRCAQGVSAHELAGRLHELNAPLGGLCGEQSGGGAGLRDVGARLLVLRNRRLPTGLRECGDAMLVWNSVWKVILYHVRAVPLPPTLPHLSVPRPSLGRLHPKVFDRAAQEAVEGFGALGLSLQPVAVLIPHRLPECVEGEGVGMWSGHCVQPVTILSPHCLMKV